MSHVPIQGLCVREYIEDDRDDNYKQPLLKIILNTGVPIIVHLQKVSHVILSMCCVLGWMLCYGCSNDCPPPKSQSMEYVLWIGMCIGWLCPMTAHLQKLNNAISSMDCVLWVVDLH